MCETAKHQFFSLGTQYYVSGRFAVSARLLPVCGNLFHHAIEMYFKGVLSRTHSLSDLKTKFGNHDLKKMWAHLKVQESDARLNEYDSIIADLNRFEDLRYPDKVLNTGMSCTIDFGQPIANVDGSVLRPEPDYRFDIVKVDSLVKVLFEKASLNPKAFKPQATLAKKYLAEPSIALAFA